MSITRVQFDVDFGPEHGLSDVTTISFSNSDDQKWTTIMQRPPRHLGYVVVGFSALICSEFHLLKLWTLETPRAPDLSIWNSLRPNYWCRHFPLVTRFSDDTWIKARFLFEYVPFIKSKQCRESFDPTIFLNGLKGPKTYFSIQDRYIAK